MSRTLGLKVIAEGAETKDHIDFIRRADCDDVQGTTTADLCRRMTLSDL